ncbi:MAG: RNA polymerase sigma factor [Deltaproteobacteria bacterium]|nr:RNA polymerase sigma factor [Deltaproteobacteria bacterium]
MDVTELSDFELLERWRAGDRGAGDRLFSRHVKPLFRFFRNKVDDALAEDLTQSTLLGCAASRDRLRGESSFRTYLFAIARKQLLMHFRGRLRDRHEVALETMSVVDLGASPSTMLRAGAEQRLLLQALQRLPVDFQIAVELYYWEGLSTAEIAGVLEVADGTVRSRLSRARTQLAETMAALADAPAQADSGLERLETVARSLADLDRDQSGG